MVTIIIYGAFMFVCGLITGLYRQHMYEMRIAECQNEYGKPDEEIVCNNATVVVDKRGEISWYNNKKVPYHVKNRGD